MEYLQWGTCSWEALCCRIDTRGPIRTAVQSPRGSPLRISLCLRWVLPFSISSWSRRWRHSGLSYGDSDDRSSSLTRTGFPLTCGSKTTRQGLLSVLAEGISGYPLCRILLPSLQMRIIHTQLTVLFTIQYLKHGTLKTHLANQWLIHSKITINASQHFLKQYFSEYTIYMLNIHSQYIHNIYTQYIYSIYCIYWMYCIKYLVELI